MGGGGGGGNMLPQIFTMRALFLCNEHLWIPGQFIIPNRLFWLSVTGFSITEGSSGFILVAAYPDLVQVTE